MDIVFKEKYVNYDEISNISLIDINKTLIENDISLELGDNFSNDWAGYTYHVCKSLDELDEQTISSFVYIITWFMTNNPIDINSNFKSDKYYKNNKIINECLKIYNNLFKECSSEIDLCERLFLEIYDFYLNNHESYIKRTERMNCVLTYKELELFDSIDGISRSDKLKFLLDKYYFIELS